MSRVGLIILGLGVLLWLANVFVSLGAGKPAGSDPWDGRGSSDAPWVQTTLGNGTMQPASDRHRDADGVHMPAPEMRQALLALAMTAFGSRCALPRQAGHARSTRRRYMFTPERAEHMAFAQPDPT